MKTKDKTQLITRFKNSASTEKSGDELALWYKNHYNKDDVKGWMVELKRLIDHDCAPELAKWLEIALLGACVGFVERNLNPFAKEHLPAIKQIMEDVEFIFNELSKNAPVEFDEVSFQLYDYAVQVIYKLDWDLYLSQECY